MFRRSASNSFQGRERKNNWNALNLYDYDTKKITC